MISTLRSLLRSVSKLTSRVLSACSNEQLNRARHFVTCNIVEKKEAREIAHSYIRWYINGAE